MLPCCTREELMKRVLDRQRQEKACLNELRNNCPASIGGVEDIRAAKSFGCSVKTLLENPLAQGSGAGPPRSTSDKTSTSCALGTTTSSLEHASIRGAANVSSNETRKMISITPKEHFQIKDNDACAKSSPASQEPVVPYRSRCFAELGNEEFLASQKEDTTIPCIGFDDDVPTRSLKSEPRLPCFPREKIMKRVLDRQRQEKVGLNEFRNNCPASIGGVEDVCPAKSLVCKVNTLLGISFSEGRGVCTPRSTTDNKSTSFARGTTSSSLQHASIPSPANVSTTETRKTISITPKDHCVVDDKDGCAKTSSATTQLVVLYRSSHSEEHRNEERSSSQNENTAISCIGFDDDVKYSSSTQAKKRPRTSEQRNSQGLYCSKFFFPGGWGRQTSLERSSLIAARQYDCKNVYQCSHGGCLAAFETTDIHRLRERTANAITTSGMTHVEYLSHVLGTAYDSERESFGTIQVQITPVLSLPVCVSAYALAHGFTSVVFRQAALNVNTGTFVKDSTFLKQIQNNRERKDTDFVILCVCHILTQRPTRKRFAKTTCHLTHASLPQRHRSVCKGPHVSARDERSSWSHQESFRRNSDVC